MRSWHIFCSGWYLGHVRARDEKEAVTLAERAKRYTGNPDIMQGKPTVTAAG